MNTEIAKKNRVRKTRFYAGQFLDEFYKEWNVEF